MCEAWNVFFFPVVNNCPGIIYWRNHPFPIVHFSLITKSLKKLVVKFLLYSSTCVAPWVSLSWVKYVYWPPPVGLPWLTLWDWCHLPEKYWSISGPFFLMFSDSVSVFSPLISSWGILGSELEWLTIPVCQGLRSFPNVGLLSAKTRTVPGIWGQDCWYLQFLLPILASSHVDPVTL